MVDNLSIAVYLEKYIFVFRIDWITNSLKK